MSTRDWCPAWAFVTCSRCSTSYQCTPANDYYNSTNADNGVCEPCLLGYDGRTWSMPTYSAGGDA